MYPRFNYKIGKTGDAINYPTYSATDSAAVGYNTSSIQRTIRKTSQRYRCTGARSVLVHLLKITVDTLTVSALTI